MKAIYIVATLLLCTAPLYAQQDSTHTKAWSLNDCIDYAHRNNITIQQRSLNVENSEVKLNTTRNSRLPDVSASLGADARFGRAISRDNTYINSSQLSGSLGASASMPIFQGLRINNQIKVDKLDLVAAMQDMESARKDVSINIMTLYLQVLFNKELVGVAENQLLLSTQQTQRSRELVVAGKSPESALYESEALQAKDELTLTQNRNTLTLSLLNLSQALNRQSADGFDVITPKLDSLTLASMYNLGSPEVAYTESESISPHVKAESIRLQSSENSIKVAKSALYPSIALSGGYGTSVYKSYATGAISDNFWSQLKNNGSEYVGVSVNIPIFNRRATRNSIKSAKISMRSQQLALDNVRLELRKEIEQSYYNADAAYKKYYSAEKALSSARIAFAYEKSKSEAGRSTIFDFNDAKTRMERAESELIQSKYEFIFSSKILDFHRGIPITL